MSATPPNILLLALESTPAGHVSAYGYPRPVTPHLDRLAAEATLYEQAISAAAWTLPSHASLFTGLYVSQHGTHFGSPYLRSDVVTLAEALQQRGYETAAFTTNDWVNEKFGFNRGFQTFRWSKRTLEGLQPIFPAETRLEKVIRYARDPVYPIGYRNNRLLREWIRATRRRGRPFFAYTLYFDPHYPYRPHLPYAWDFLRGQPKSWWRVNLDPDRYMAGATAMTADDFETLRALYDSRLASADAMIGRLLEWLRREKLLDDTLVIVVADHGENLGEHGLMSHQYCVYDTLVRVPLIIRYPPLFPAGRRVADLVQSLELFTTILDVVGIDRSEIPNDARGRSLIPDKLAGNPLPFAISEYLVANLARMRRLYPDRKLDHLDRGLRAIRQDGWKGIFASDGQAELYNVATDPGETRDLAAERPEILQKLQTQLEQWLHSIEGGAEPAGPERAAELDAAVVRRLQELGYF